MPMAGCVDTERPGVMQPGALGHVGFRPANQHTPIKKIACGHLQAPVLNNDTNKTQQKRDYTIRAVANSPCSLVRSLSKSLTGMTDRTDCEIQQIATGNRIVITIANPHQRAHTKTTKQLKRIKSCVDAELGA